MTLTAHQHCMLRLLPNVATPKALYVCRLRNCLTLSRVSVGVVVEHSYSCTITLGELINENTTTNDVPPPSTAANSSGDDVIMGQAACYRKWWEEVESKMLVTFQIHYFNIPNPSSGSTSDPKNHSLTCPVRHDAVDLVSFFLPGSPCHDQREPS